MPQGARQGQRQGGNYAQSGQRQGGQQQPRQQQQQKGQQQARAPAQGQQARAPAAAAVAPALCAGNTIVLKTAEDAPLCILKLAEICQDELPSSVLNILTGYGHECGAALSRHPGIDKLSFTGSTN